MKDEIKEILNWLNQIIKENKESDVSLNSCVVPFETLYKLQDYITNLQEENKRIKGNWNKLQNWLVKENEKHSQIESISNIHELGRVCRIKDFEEVLHKMNKLNGGDE